MRARRHQWIPTAVAAAIVFTTGCRGTQPLDGMVNVTNDPGVELPDVDAPPQRLAIAKSRVAATAAPRSASAANGRRSVADTTSSVASSPSARDAANSRDSAGKPQPAGNTTAAKRVSQGATPATNEVADDASSPDAVMKEIQAALESTSGDPKQASAGDSSGSGNSTKNATESEYRTLAERAAKKIASLPKAQQAELLAAFRNSPPEIQKQAIRQLVATAADDADSTDQPSGIERALTESLDDLPELSDAPDESGEKPTRLAADQTGDDSGNSSAPQRMTLSDQTAKSDDSKQDASKPQPSPPLPDSVAQAAGPAESSTPSAADGVQRASATEETDGKQNDVSQAVMESEASAPQSTPEQLSDQELYDMLVQRLSEPVEGESEADQSRRKIMARHLMVFAGNPDRAVEGIEGLTDKEQEYLRHQLLGLWTIIDPKGHPVPGRRFSTALPQFREATKYLAAATDTLAVRSLAFCTEIESYGQVKKFPDNRFQSGQQVILYSEVDNFTVKQVEQGYETHLQGSYDVYDSLDAKVASQMLPADRQVSSNFLRDYFIAYRMHLPQQLAPGTYRLQLTMEDVNGKKYGQSNIQFEIVK